MALQNNQTIQLKYVLINPYHIDSNIKLSYEVEPEISKELMIENAYIKILSLKCTKESVHMTVGTYKTRNASVPLKVEVFDFIPDVSTKSDNFIKQGYEYLKNLLQYADAIDILEEDQML